MQSPQSCSNQRESTAVLTEKEVSALHSLSTSVWKTITDALDFKESDLTVLVKSLGQTGYSVTDQITSITYFPFAYTA